MYSANLALKKGRYMIIVTISLDPDLILFSDPDPLKKIIEDPGGSGSTTLSLS